MTEQAYNEALADLRKWHEGDRFQKHFNEIEAHVKALSALTEVKSLPPPMSILLTRDATGRLHDPTTGEPFTVVIDTLDGRKEVTHITFQGERDVPTKLPDPVYVDPEPKPLGEEFTAEKKDYEALTNAEIRQALYDAVAQKSEDTALAILFNVHPDRLRLSEIGVSGGEFNQIVALEGDALLAALKEALDTPYVFGNTAADDAPVTIDGLPVVLSDEPLLTTVQPDVAPVTADAVEDEQDDSDADAGEDDTPDEAAPTDIATSADAVPAAPPARKSKKKRG